MTARRISEDALELPLAPRRAEHPVDVGLRQDHIEGAVKGFRFRPSSTSSIAVRHELTAPSVRVMIRLPSIASDREAER